MNTNNSARLNETIDLNSIVSKNKSLYFTITLLGSVLNCLNVAVLRSDKLKDKSFKYFLAISLADLAYLAIFNADSMLKIFELTNTFGEQHFQLICINYLTSCLALFVILADLVNSLSRCFICWNKYYIKDLSTKRVLIVLLLISMISYLPELASKSVQLNPIKLKGFHLVPTRWGESKLCRLLVISIWSTRMFISSFVLTIVNFVSAIALIQRILFKTKDKLNTLGIFY